MPNVIGAVSRVPIVPVTPATTWRSADRIDQRCTVVYPGVDAQLRYRIILPWTSIVELSEPRPPTLMAFHRDGEEWIVERSCLHAR